MLKNIFSRTATTLALSSIILLISSCGNDSTVATDGELLVDTSAITYLHLGTPVAGGGCTNIVGGMGANTDDSKIKITTIGVDGNPTGKLDVELSASFAENTSSGGAVTALFTNDKGVDTLISAATDLAPFTATTDEFGVLFITFRYDTTYDANCVYGGQIKIASGLHTSTVDFSVSVAAP